MLTLQITKDQVFTLIDQLSLNEQQEVLQYLVRKTREDLDDTPDDIVVEGIKQGLKEAMRGQTIPLSQMWEGIDVECGGWQYHYQRCDFFTFISRTKQRSH